MGTNDIGKEKGISESGNEGNKGFRHTDFMALIQTIIDTGKNDKDVSRLFKEHNIPVEEINVVGVPGAVEFSDEVDIDIIELKTPEELEYDRATKSFTDKDLFPVNKLLKLKPGDIVDIELRGFVQFIIHNIKGMVVKNGKTYCACVISAIKIIPDKDGKGVSKKFIINKNTLISLPIEENGTLTIYEELHDRTVQLKISGVRSNRTKNDGVKGLLSRIGF